MGVEDVGLGPLICVDCELYARENDQQDYYRCPRCGSTVLDYLWMFTAEEQRCINANNRFYRFAQGQE